VNRPRGLVTLVRRRIAASMSPGGPPAADVPGMPAGVSRRHVRRNALPPASRQEMRRGAFDAFDAVNKIYRAGATAKSLGGEVHRVSLGIGDGRAWRPRGSRPARAAQGLPGLIR